MNACSKITKAKRRSLKVRIHSDVYRVGLCEGFGAFALFFNSRDYRFTNSVDASIGGTWKAVGDAIKTAALAKERISGKTTRETEHTD